MDYEEELNHKLNLEYFQVYAVSDELLEFARAGDEYYNRRE